MQSRGKKFKIGLSFFWQFLAYGEDPNHPDEWKLAIPNLDEALDRLQAKGLSTIEIKSTVDPDILEWKKIVAKLLDRGFDLTFHASGRFNYPLNYRWVIEDVRRISTALINEFPLDNLLWVIHPLYDIGKSRALIYRNNQAYLNEFLEMTRDLPIRLALENLRNRDDNIRVHVGDTYREVLVILSEFPEGELGICWDFGHACAMEELGQDRPIPPDDFLQKVVHCHVHDCEKQITHLPPGKGRVHWQQALKMLNDAGYDGILNMEAVPYKLENPAQFLNSIEDSIELLTSIIADLA